MIARLRAAWVPLVLVAAASGWAALVFPTVAASPGALVAEGAFQLPHLWAFDHVARMMWGELPWSTTTDRIGFPGPVEARFIAWVPMLAAGLLHPLVGAVASFNLVTLATPAATALATWALVRRVAPRSDPAAAGLVAVLYATSPFMLANLVSGQVCKGQQWVFPVGVLAMVVAVHPGVVAPGRLRLARAAGRDLGHLAALALASAAAAFTEPTYALLLPFAWGATAVWAVLEGDPEPIEGRWAWAARRVGPLVRGPLALAAAAAGMYPAKEYYGGAATATISQAFHPATRPVVITDVPTRVATWNTTILGQVDWPRNLVDTVHVTYLTATLLVVGVIGFGIGRRLGRLGFALTVAGTVLAVGEYAVRGRSVVYADGEPVALPAAWLAHWGYPLATSGMYYRAVAVVILGLVLGAVAAVARVGSHPRLGARGPLVALGLAVAIVGGATWDGLRATTPLWPRAAVPIQGAALWEEVAKVPGDDAVLAAPWVSTTNEWRRYLGGAVLHGHPTNALPRALRPQEIPVLGQLDRSLQAALTEPDPRAAIRALGIRWVVWYPIPVDAPPDLPTLVHALGPGTTVDGLRVWDLSDDS